MHGFFKLNVRSLAICIQQPIQCEEEDLRLFILDILMDSPVCFFSQRNPRSCRPCLGFTKQESDYPLILDVDTEHVRKLHRPVGRLPVTEFLDKSLHIFFDFEKVSRDDFSKVTDANVLTGSNMSIKVLDCGC